MKKQQKKIEQKANGSSMITKITIAAVAAVACIGGGTVAVKKMNNSSANTKVLTPSGIENVEETIKEEKSGGVSIVKRNIDVDGVESFLNNTSKSYLVNISEENPDPFNSGYTSNAILVEKDDLYGFYDYDGNVLTSPSYEYINVAGKERWSTYEVYDADLENYVLAGYYLFSNDFKTVSLEDAENGYAMSDIMTIPYVHNNTLTYYIMDNLTDEPYENTSGQTILVGADTGSATIDADNNILCQMNGYGGGTFANGFVFLNEQEPETHMEDGDLITIQGNYALFNALTGEQLTDFDYFDTGYMWDGYAPVEKDGKWGFVDEEGNLVVDYIFEDSSSLYDEKAYVKYNGEWMIINVVESLQNGEITTETMNAALA